MKYLIVTFIVSILSGCTYNAGYNKGVRLYHQKKDTPYLQAGYYGGIIIGFMEESVADGKREMSKKYIKETLDELKLQDPK